MTREMSNAQYFVMGMQSVVVIWMRSDYELMPDDGLLEVVFVCHGITFQGCNSNETP